MNATGLPENAIVEQFENTTTFADFVDNFTVDPTDYGMDSQQYMAIAILMIVFFGVCGNLLSILLFSRPHMRCSSVNVLLLGLSMVDLSLLLMSIPVFVVPPGLMLWSSQEFHDCYMAFILKFVYPTNLIMQTCSVYTMLLITFERWTAVCRPLQVRLWCTPKKSRTALIVVFLSACAYNVVRFFEYSIETDENGNYYYSRNLRAQKVYMIGYFTCLYILTHFLIPFSAIAVMNFHVIWTMWTQRRQRAMLTRQQQREQSTTVMLLVVIVIFAVCNTLPFLINIIECIFPDFFSNPSTSNIAYQLNDAGNLLVVLNSATTFLVYLTFSEKYRHTLVFICKKGCFAKTSDYNMYTSMSRTQSVRVNSFVVQKDDSKVSPSKSSDMLLKPLYAQKRTDRATSEYNERTKFYIAEKNSSMDDSIHLRHQTTIPRTKRGLPRMKKQKKAISVSSSEDGRQPPKITVTQSESIDEEDSSSTISAHSNHTCG